MSCQISIPVFLLLSLTFSFADEVDREAFKKRMMPLVGKTVTVTGKIQTTSKQGPELVMTDGNYVLVSDLKIDDGGDEESLKGKLIAVTGKLGFREASDPAYTRKIKAAPYLEAFYIIPGQVSVPISTPVTR
jgi:hypothetical protein